jgi:protein ImuB
VPSGSRAAGEDAPELWLAVQLGSCTEAQLEPLATRAQRFTPRVSLAPPDGLLLEVKGSLHLFGGLEPLLQAVAAELGADGPATLAVAPVPRAALAAARAGRPLVVTSLARLVGQLAPLPLAALGWPQELLERLASAGVRSIGQALRLPRAGFARRFGPLARADLDQLTGREPDVRKRHEARTGFRRRRELLREVEHHGELIGQLTPLLSQLGELLERRQLAVLGLTCLLWHREGSPTRCALRLAAPEGDAGRLATLLGERLRSCVLAQPVRACELRAHDLVPRTQLSGNLWQPGEHGGGGASVAGVELIERLRTRLGATAVYGLQFAASHRPESAWRATTPAVEPPRVRVRGGPPEPLPSLQRRPVWLLRVPQPLSERDGRPWRGGPLRLEGGTAPEPERIETGWWDGAEVRRDYYLAQDAQGVRLWIFREHAAPRGWYLHGVFA